MSYGWVKTCWKGGFVDTPFCLPEYPVPDGHQTIPLLAWERGHLHTPIKHPPTCQWRHHNQRQTSRCQLPSEHEELLWELARETGRPGYRARRWVLLVVFGWAVNEARSWDVLFLIREARDEDQLPGNSSVGLVSQLPTWWQHCPKLQIWLSHGALLSHSWMILTSVCQDLWYLRP